MIDTPKKPKANHYVDNEKLSSELLSWVKEFKANKELGAARPKVPEYIGESILLIARNLARSPKFNRYTWIEEMIGDAIENMLLYLHNFNGDVDTRTGRPNAFSWMSFSMERVFYDRIETEKRQQYYKNAMGSNTDWNAELESVESGSTGVTKQVIDDMRSRAGDYEDAQKKRREKERAKNKPTPKVLTTQTLEELF